MDPSHANDDPDRPLITLATLREGLLPLCALYASIEGGVRIYEYFSSEEVRFWFSEGAIFRLFNATVFCIFVAHWVTSLREAVRGLVAGLLLLILLVVALACAMFGPPAAIGIARNAPKTAQEYLKQVEALPVGSIYEDPFQKKSMIRTPWGSEPLDDLKGGMPQWMKDLK